MTTTDINQQIQAFNKDVAGWGKRVRNQTIFNARKLKDPEARPRSKVKTMRSNDEEVLSQSIGQKTYKSDGEIDCIGFSFARHGVFWQKGVGRGYVMQNGIVTRGQKKRIGINKHDKRTTFIATAGPIRRKPVDWFNGLISREVETLADIVADHHADRVINATRMTIR